MTRAMMPDAQVLLGHFLGADIHYRASAAAYGDGGAKALANALELFLDRPELGFVWLAHAGSPAARTGVGACVVCRAISTSRGAVVVKLDDVTVHPHWLSRGVGGRMLAALLTHLPGKALPGSTRDAIATTPAPGASTNAWASSRWMRSASRSCSDNTS